MNRQSCFRKLIKKLLFDIFLNVTKSHYSTPIAYPCRRMQAGKVGVGTGEAWDGHGIGWDDRGEREGGFGGFVTLTSMVG